MRDLSDEPRQTLAESKDLGAKPAWSAPRFEVLNIDQTANSGFFIVDGSVSTGS